MKPNILFILVDSMRADKCFQNQNASTINIDKLIKNGIYFKNAFSSSDYTITGYGSIFTGIYPINAGVEGMSYHKIFSIVPNFINYLHENNYHTYAIIESALIELGFGAYFENNDKGYDRTKTNLFQGLGQKILKKIESDNLKEPWFYLIHLDDLHIPIKVPEKFADRTYSQRYDIVVSEIDAWLGKILEKIDLEKTLIIITADHGDYLLSIDDTQKNTLNQKLKSKLRGKIPKPVYDYISGLKRGTSLKIKKSTAKTSLEKRSLETRTAKERFLFDDLIHVPLIMSGYGIPSKEPQTVLTRSVDIFPTILDVIGLPSENPLINGRSLKLIFEGKTLQEEPIYLENTIFETDTKNPQPCVGLRTSRYKYFRSLKDANEKIHLFDLNIDPFEENNIASKSPEIVKKMEKTLSQIRDKLTKEFKKPSMTDEEIKKVEEELKKLGYI